MEIPVVTKAELPDASGIRDDLSAKLDRQVHLISAVTGQGLNELTGEIVRRLAERDRDAS